MVLTPQEDMDVIGGWNATKNGRLYCDQHRGFWLAESLGEKFEGRI